MLSCLARATRALAPAIVLFAGACADGATGPQPDLAARDVPPTALQAMQCTASIRAGVTCQDARALAGGARFTIIGGQQMYVWLRSSNMTYTAADSTLSFDVTIENLLNEALGTVDGVTPDSAGVRVFFANLPTAPEGEVAVYGSDGTMTFTRAGQPYYQYGGILAKNDTSEVERWAMKVPPGFSSVSFGVYVAAETQRRVVINEVMLNPGGTVQDSVGEYVELYNAGTLPTNLNGFVLRDNTAGITDTIKTDLLVDAGGYVLLGRSTNTAKNGGITPDYLYTSRVGPTSTSLQFSNSGSDFFVVRAPTGVQVDSVFYSSGTTTAVAGVARELKNPALNNTLVDGSSWGAATPFYDGSSNRGTPRAQNSNFTPVP